MYTFLLLFINNHIQQRFRIERMFFFWKIVLLPLRFQYWFHRRSNICSLFHKIISKVVSTLLLDWDCLLDIDYGAHEFTSDVLVVCVVCSFSVFSAQYLWIVLGHVIFTFYIFFVILYWFITFGHVVVQSEFIFIYKYNLCQHTSEHGIYSYWIWSLVVWTFTMEVVIYMF